MDTDTAGGAIAALAHALAHVRQHHAERAADPRLARALAELGDWQARRLKLTYADLERMPRYAAAIAFFETDLYGGGDFAQRDADLARVVPAMRRLMPEHVIATVATAIELAALSQQLDRAMVDALRSTSALTVRDYCAAYRAVGRFDVRLRQIDLTGDIGAALDRMVGKSMIRAALTMMRKPARLAGLATLQDFLERGFAAFSQMRGATEFLATIRQRETAIHDAIAGGSDAPFPDPLGE